MDVVDAYTVLGLPSGEEGAKLSEREISKAYKLKALELHPDKRPDDRHAHANFQKLKSAYEILKNEKARKLFDHLLKVKREQQQCHRHSQQDFNSKRRKMMSDLEEREKAAFAPELEAKAREEEERIAKKLKEEIASLRAMHVNKRTPKPTPTESVFKRKENIGVGLDKNRMLKVSWEKLGGGGEDYSVERLREVFSKFGKVDDILIESSKKKSCALIVMASKDAAVAAVCRSLSNPLLVLPLQPTQKSVEHEE